MRKKLTRVFALCLTLALVCMAFASCAAASSASSAAADYESTDMYEAPAESSAAPAEQSEVYDEATAGSEAAAADKGSGVNGAVIPNAASGDLKLIYNASFQINTKEYESDLKKLTDAVKTAGGYVSSENTYGTAPEEYGDGGRTTQLIVRVPVDSYTGFMTAVDGIGTVENRSQSVSDVTEQYYDTDARIEMYETRKARLEEHLAKATKMTDIISLEDEISQILYELDTLKGSKRYLDNQIAYSTVDITLNERVDAKKVVVSSDDLGTRAGDAFSESMLGVGTFFEDFAVFFVGALPVLIILAAIAGITLLIIWLAKRGKKKKRVNALPPQDPNNNAV